MADSVTVQELRDHVLRHHPNIRTNMGQEWKRARKRDLLVALGASHERYGAVSEECAGKCAGIAWNRYR